MRKLVSRRPSPSMIIAVIALVVALAGTAVAGVATISKLSKSEKRKVRNLANQEIDKRAPGLSVKSAGSATTAGAAGHASTADNAAIAGDVSNQMWAVISSDGATSISRATPGIIGVERINPTGQFRVSTDRDVRSCFYLATLGGSPPGATPDGQIAVNPLTSTPNAVIVATQNGSGSPADRNFTILIRC